MQDQTCAAARSEHDDCSLLSVIREFIQSLRWGLFLAAPRLAGVLDRIERMP